MTKQAVSRTFHGLLLLILAGWLAACDSQPSAERRTSTPSPDRSDHAASALPAPSASASDLANGAKTSGAESGTAEQTSALVPPLETIGTASDEPPRPAPRQIISLPPQNDCSVLPGWSGFRERLEKAVRAKDTNALIALASADIRLDYGGGSGRAELAKRLTDAKRALWQELADILPLGCATDNGLTVMPWYFWKVPEDIDAYTAFITTGPDVPILAGPGSDAKALKNLKWAIVSIEGPLKPGAPYTKVTATEDTSGYIRTSQLRSLLDYRIIAENRAGEWRITAFIAGD